MIQRAWWLGPALVSCISLLFATALFSHSAFSDNLVNSGGIVKFDAGSTGTMKVKIVSNTAQSEKGDPQDGCNAEDDSPALVTLLSEPAGLTYAPNPLIFTQCGVNQTVTFSSNTPGTYTVTATISDTGSGVYHLEPFGKVTVIVGKGSTQASITIDAITPNPTVWGSPVFATGSVVGATSSNTVEVNWGDGSKTSNVPVSNNLWGPVSHTYGVPGDYQVIAYLKDGETTVATSSLFQIVVNKHATQLDLSIPAHVTGDTGFTAGGTLRDLSTNNVGIPGKLITFDGTGVTPSLQAVTTQGITFTGVVEIASCRVSDLGPCSVDNLGTDPDTGDNKVLHLGVGGKISFPEDTSEVKLFLQDMGNTAFKYRVIEYTGNPQNCLDPLDGQNCPSAGSDYPLVAFIDTVSGFTTVNGVTAFNGIKEIVITEVNGSTTDGTVGIAAVLTMNTNGKPVEQHEINFENEIAEVKSSPFTVNGGSYFSVGIAQFEEEDALRLQAHFGGDQFYEPSDSSVLSYDVQSNLGNLAGVGGESASGDGVSVTKYDCSTIGSTDNDKDGICSTWESTGIVSIPSGTYVLPEVPAGDSIPDVYFEIDAMSGYAPTQAEINTIKNIFDKKGIKLHVQLDETNLAVKNPFHVWTDTENPNDPDNDYVSVKNNHFGTLTERDKAAGIIGDNVFGTLGQGADLLEAKLHVVRYTVFVQNINSGTNTACGTSGIAELQGNDAIVALGCGFGINPSEERMGTLMHEWGHLLGLRHGGNDDENCKPNQKSVMSYAGQVPWSLLPKPSAGQTTNVGWYLGYSSQALTAISETDVDDGFVLNIDPAKWKASDGVTSIQSFKIIWGTPQLATKVQTGTTGTPINWDKDGNSGELNQQIDLNYMSITLGNKQIPACTPANSAKTSLANYDEWTTIKTKLNFRSQGTLDGFGASTHTDPDQLNEPTPELYDALNALGYQFSGVKEPLNNVDFDQPGIHTTKKGNTIPVMFNLFDSQGNEITGDNAQTVYHIVKRNLKVAEVVDSSLPSDIDYVPPETSTQTEFQDFFTWDGSKWSFQLGTKNLAADKTYAARICLVLDTEEQIVLDTGQDGITFLFKLTK